MFEQLLKGYGGSDEDLLINRPMRIEHFMEVLNCTREQAAAADLFMIRTMQDVSAAMGKAMDETAPPILRIALGYVGTATAMLMGDLASFLLETEMASELSNGPLVINPRKPHCTCNACATARAIDSVRRSAANSVN
jgi:hypothetical protein